MSEMGIPKSVTDLFTPRDFATMKGPSKQASTYAAWFNGASAEQKRNVLGDSLYDRLRKRGAVLWTKAVRAFGLRFPKVASLLALRRAAKRVDADEPVSPADV